MHDESIRTMNLFNTGTFKRKCTISWNGDSNEYRGTAAASSGTYEYPHAASCKKRSFRSAGCIFTGRKEEERHCGARQFRGNPAGIILWQEDITKLACDAIVNAANSGMTGCYVPNHNCIHTFAGMQLREECAEIIEEQGYAEPTGKAKITKAYNLPCKYILHTVGPIIQGTVTKKDCELLKSCYTSCLVLAAENGLESVAFCCISTGEFHFPNEKAAQIAVATVKEFLKQNTSVRKVIFNVFKDLDKAIYEGILQ